MRSQLTPDRHPLGFIDLRELKREVLRLYPAGHPLREALLREQDIIPEAEALGKLLVFLSLSAAKS